MLVYWPSVVKSKELWDVATVCFFIGKCGGIFKPVKVWDVAGIKCCFISQVR